MHENQNLPTQSSESDQIDVSKAYATCKDISQPVTKIIGMYSLLLIRDKDN